jgi:hypothetical protein
MRNKAVPLALAAVALLFSTLARAKTIYFGSAPETVPIAAGSVTVLRFDEAVKTVSNAQDFIIKPVNEEAPDYSTLSIEPRQRTGKADAAFILASGEICRLRLSVVPREAGLKVETLYELKSQKALIESRADATPYVGRLELMTAMIRGDQVAGYEVSAPKRQASAKKGTAKVTLERIYSGSDFKGYVYEVQNLTSEEVDIDIRRLQFGKPNQAVLAYSDLDLLEKKGSEKDKTRLIVIAKSTAGYRDAVLPIRVSHKPKAQKGGDEND